MNKIVNKFLLIGDKFMYSACGPSKETKKDLKKSKNLKKQEIHDKIIKTN